MKNRYALGAIIAAVMLASGPSVAEYINPIAFPQKGDPTDVQVVIVANLKPAKLMGLESQGMVLAATDADGQPILLRPHAPGVAPGTRVK